MVKDVPLSSTSKDIQSASKNKVAVTDASTNVLFTPLEELQSLVTLVQKAVTSKDIQLIHRVLRSASVLRRKVSKHDVMIVVSENLSNEMATETNKLVELVSEEKVEQMDAVMSNVADEVEGVLPEVELFLRLFVFQIVWEKKVFVNEAKKAIEDLVKFAAQFNRRTCDLLVSRVYYYFGLVEEQTGQLVAIRNLLLTSFRTACLHHDEATQAVLTNLILRSYLSENLYVLADKFRLNSSFPVRASNYQHARYHYLVGWIDAIQLDYTQSLENLKQALRKAPSTRAIGFRQACTKLLVIVHLLMGEIPERSIFSTEDLKQSLVPYLQLALSVRVGDLALFGEAMSKFADIFKRDKTFSLITRLRNNVIKTGLVKISVCYSRISLADIRQKLLLPSEEDAESIVSKAIADGVIEATIDHENRFVYSKDAADVYATTDPQIAFHKRTKFCLDLHSESVKALRYPQHMKKELAETDEERADREAFEADLMDQLHDDEGADE